VARRRHSPEDDFSGGQFNHLTDRFNDQVRLFDRNVVPAIVGNDQVHVPMATKTQTLADAMDQIWAMFLYFVEDFIALFTSMRFAENYVPREKPRDPTSVKSPWDEP